MIPQRNLSLIANELKNANGQRIQESVIERDYCLAWFLNGLANHNLRDVLAFKGGTVLRRCYFTDYRFSEDLDFTLMQIIDLPAILAGLDEIFAAVADASGMVMAFDHADKDSHQNAFTFYLKYQGPLPAANTVKVDMTIKEQVCFDLVEVPIIKTYANYEDLPEGRIIKAYDLREVLVEKLTALTDRARNEPRDLYDLWYLLTYRDLSFDMVHRELEAKFKFRNRKVEALGETVMGKRERFERLWKGRLAHQMTDLPEFDSVFRTVHRALREAGL